MVYDLKKIEAEIETSDNVFQIVPSENNNEEYVNFLFIGVYEGKKVIYDAAMYSLQLHYVSELYEMAEHEAAKRFPEFNPIRYDEDENGDMIIPTEQDEAIGLFITEYIAQLEEEGEVKVREHIELDTRLEGAIGMEVGLNVDEITKQTIHDFVSKYNDDTIALDKTLYTFKIEDEDESS